MKKRLPDPFNKFKISYAAALEKGPLKFVEENLFPAMRIEHGNRFAMDVWIHRDNRPESVEFDGIPRICKSAACIGGTISMLVNDNTDDDFALGKLLGLDSTGMRALFFNFYPIEVDGAPSWPITDARAFAAAQTPAEKEKVAEKVVLLAIKTKGACFLPR